MPAQRPIRIANASGVINDGLDQLYRQAQNDIDAITADYLAEFNIAWKALEQKAQPELGFETSFLEQLAYKDGEAARLIASKNIKVVHDGGALNPKGLATKVAEYFKSLGIEGVRIAWVEGDDVTGLVKDGKMGGLKHLDIEGAELIEKEKVLAANVYTGMAGIINALEAGADIVVCGRCCDASPVMALAAWWHGWKSTDYQELAGALLAGHLIECSAYVTGGNYCGFQEVKDLYRVGYPITEISSDGTSIITKPENSNGIVTVDTCKAQLLYEIQGHYYLNPDVTAQIDCAKLVQVGKNRVKLTAIVGSAPPPTSKLSICLWGGWQAEMSAYASGLDVSEKLDLLKDQVTREINLKDYTTFSMTIYGTAGVDPKSQAECTCMLRMFAQSEEKEPLTAFRRAIFYNGMQGHCGLHLNMDWRTMEPRPYVKYFPSLVPSSQVPLTVHFVDDPDTILQVAANDPTRAASVAPTQPSYDTADPVDLFSFGETIRRPLGDLVFARSGDKGGNSNMGIWVRNAEAYPWLRTFLTRQNMIELLGKDWKDQYRIERCELPELYAVHFVVKGLLQDGVSSSSVLDGFGKSVVEFVRARWADIPVKLLEQERELRRKNGWAMAPL